jgi:hypothetical protein
MPTIYTPGNEPYIEEREPRRKMSVIGLKKQKPKERFYHCSVHTSSRMVRMADGLRCPICGSPDVAIRIVDTVE